MPSRNTAPPASDGVIAAPPERAATHRTNRAVACILARSDAQEIRSVFSVNIPEGSELNAKVDEVESTVESLQDQIGSGNDLSEHINVTNSYADNCNYYGGGFDYYGNLCDPEIVFSTQGTPRWKISKDGNLIPIDNDTYDIGSASYKARDIYEAD